jgi:hypothetical protein
MKKKFSFDGYTFTLLKCNQFFAVYVASEGTKILFYQVFRINDGRLVINRYGRYRELDRVKQEFEGLTKKTERNEFSQK